MRIIATIQELRRLIAEYKQQGKTIGLVPTMGYLHEGHMSLVDEAKKNCSIIVMSIFVNPLQFGQGEDLEKYPRDLVRDEQMARTRGVDILFVPDLKEMYPDKIRTTVSVSDITDRLCGDSRPGHFDGVATVVSKLFNIVAPDAAFFGQKDAQQVAVIQQMVYDLNMPIKIIACPIMRESDGLAMSSRNVYLDLKQRQQAVILNQALGRAEKVIKLGLPLEEVRRNLAAEISSQALAVIDYIEILSYPNLQPINEFYTQNEGLIVAVAVKFGGTRLIDNILLGGEGKSDVSNYDEGKNTPSYSY